MDGKISLVKIITLFLVLVSSIVSWQAKNFLEKRLDIAEKRVFTIRPGETPIEVFLEFKKEGLVKSIFWPRVLYKIRILNSDLVSQGEYLLYPGMSMLDLIYLWQKAEVVQYGIAFIEGWTFHNIREVLLKNKKIKNTLYGVDDVEIMKKIGYRGSSPEGLFFPDTYFFIKGTTDVELLRMSYHRLNNILAKEWKNRDTKTKYKNPYQALVISSLIEKETSLNKEKSRIAGVLLRRLEINMPLQVDSSVIYGLKSNYEGKLDHNKIHIVTPYNTYERMGLPPTPIAIASYSSIHAALHPAYSDSLYFVAKGDGSHIFSDNLRIHNLNVDRLRKLLNYNKIYKTKESSDC